MKPRIVSCICMRTDTMLPFAKAEDWLAEQVTPLVMGCGSEIIGLYLATTDAGVQASIQFWADGLRDGLGFANPRDFPFTLANSPAARIAIRHNLRGPNYTLIGGDEATVAVLEQAQDDLEIRLINFALVIRFDMAPVTSVTGIALANNIISK